VGNFEPEGKNVNHDQKMGGGSNRKEQPAGINREKNKN
jgi:hypothetical protein